MGVNFKDIITDCPFQYSVYLLYAHVLRLGKVTSIVMSYRYFVVALSRTLSKKTPIS